MEIILWIGVAFLLGLAANRVGLPPLLGYLAGGFALSAAGVEGGEWLHELAHYGVLFLLFALGLRIRLRNMVQPEVVGSSLLQLTISALLLTGLFALFGLAGQIGLTGAVAAGAGLIPEPMVAVLAVAVALSFAFGAPLARAAEELYERLKPLLVRFERDVRHPDAQPAQLGSARYLVVGMGTSGVAAYRYLAEQKEPVAGLDTDPGRIEAQRRAGRRVAFGDAGDTELWEALDLGRLEGVILTVPKLEDKVQATRMSGEEYEPLEAAGATSICHPLTEAGERLAEQSLDGQRLDRPASLPAVATSDAS